MIKAIELIVNSTFAVVGLVLIIAALRYPRTAFVEIPSVVFRIFLNVVREVFFVDFLMGLFHNIGSKKAGNQKIKKIAPEAMRV